MVNEVIPWDAEHPNVLHALTRKRAELSGKIEHNQLALRQLIAEMDHIDATIRIFHPDIDIGRIKPTPVPPRHRAFKGEVTRVCFDALREAKEPLTSRDIALRLMRERGLHPDDKELSVIMVKRVVACLGVQRKKGFACNAQIAGDLLGWVLVR